MSNTYSINRFAGNRFAGNRFAGNRFAGNRFAGNRFAGLIASAALSATVLCGCSGSGSGSGSQIPPAAKAAPTETTADKAPAVPTIAVVKVRQEDLSTHLQLPGQLLAYQDVPIHAKVEGFVSSINVDRGSIVHQGQLLVTVKAPEMDAQVKEAQAKESSSESAYSRAKAGYQSIISKKEQSQAKLDADALTFKRLQAASATPGAIAQNEVDLAQKSVESDKALLESIGSEVTAASHVVAAEKNNVDAVRNVVASKQALQSYLKIRAPFDGVITERNVHEGSIVATDSGRTSVPMLRIQEKSLLRLVVAVPEASVAGIKEGTMVPFTVPAFLGKTFQGKVARLGYALDEKTRTMPVEMNVPNADGQLEPGMFATVDWTVNRPYATMFIPPSAVATDLKGTFVVLIRDGISERVPVIRGQQMGNLQEIVGAVQPGDEVALTATDEIQPGTHLLAQLADDKKIQSASKHTSSSGE